jgi:hypothetical protein
MNPSAIRSPVVRPRSFAEFDRHAPRVSAGNSHWVMRAQNFLVERVVSGGEPFAVESNAEMLLVLPDAAAVVMAEGAGTPVAEPGPGSVCLLAAGRYTVRIARAGTCTVIASNRPDLDSGTALNAAAYAEPDARIAPTGHPYARRTVAPAAQVYEMARIEAPKDNPRLKMLQTDTLSINWVEYWGERDRTALSPHSHADLEQGSLALAGDYIHHLRVTWGRNANLWQPDEHLPAPSPSLAIIPVDLIHTTEGVGGGHHLLLDIFSPPRKDFIAKGWVHNAADYAATDDSRS